MLRRAGDGGTSQEISCAWSRALTCRASVLRICDKVVSLCLTTHSNPQRRCLVDMALCSVAPKGAPRAHTDKVSAAKIRCAFLTVQGQNPVANCALP
jgi:hypothetical protein